MRLAAFAYASANTHAGHEIWATLLVGAILLGMPLVSLWFLWRSDDGPDEPGPDGGSGGGPPPPERPPPPDGPAWWPEFEREFADYVRDRPNYALGVRGSTW